MRVLVVHPEMTLLGGGERLCCDTIRAMVLMGHEVTVLSTIFDSKSTEAFFGYEGLFDQVRISEYPRSSAKLLFGTPSHLLYITRAQVNALKRLKQTNGWPFDVIFSTQDPGYIPDFSLPVLQWGYFPRYFPARFPKSLASLPLQLYYRRKISRVGLVLAISRYSKSNLDQKWKRPSVIVYPACNMVAPRTKRNLVVTVGRAIPAKRLELFWEMASSCPESEFAMLLTEDPGTLEYSRRLASSAPRNGKVVLNPPKATYHEFLGNAKVYLHMMEGEHFGITIAEAMSAGCVPVVHNSGGPREYVDEGLGFRWNSVEEVPNMIRQAMKNSPSTSCRLKAEGFSFEVFRQRLHEIFSELPA